MKKFFNKKIVKIIAVVLVCVTALGVVAGITSSVSNDKKSISAGVFSRGGLDENGEYVNTNKTLYTKESFGCLGLRVEPDFESNLTYDIFFYDSLNRCVDTAMGLSEVYGEELVHPAARTCRIVIHPEIPSDVSAKDFSIGYFEVRKIAKGLNITVDKDQKSPYDDSENFVASVNPETNKTVSGDTFTVSDDTKSTMKVYKNIDISNEEFYSYDIFVKCSELSDLTSCSIIVSSDNKVVSHSTFSMGALDVGEWGKMTLDLDDIEHADFIYICVPNESDCIVYGYN